MRNETIELKKKHGVPRKSIIWGEEAPLSDMDLTANDRSVIIITTSGYIKRIPLDEYKSQVRGGKGKISAKLNNEEDTGTHYLITYLSFDSLVIPRSDAILLVQRPRFHPIHQRTRRCLQH